MSPDRMRRLRGRAVGTSVLVVGARQRKLCPMSQVSPEKAQKQAGNMLVTRRKEETSDPLNACASPSPAPVLSEARRDTLRRQLPVKTWSAYPSPSCRSQDLFRVWRIRKRRLRRLDKPGSKPIYLGSNRREGLADDGASPKGDFDARHDPGSCEFFLF